MPTDNIDFTINSLIQKKPRKLVLQENGITIVDIRREYSLFKELKLWSWESLYDPLYLVLDTGEYRQWVVYELSYAGELGGTASHISQLLDTPLPTTARYWLEQQFSLAIATTETLTPRVNLHDLIHATTEQKAYWLAPAINNTLAMYNSHDNRDERDKLALGMAQQFFNSLPDGLRQQAIGLIINSKCRSLYLLPDSLKTADRCDIAVTSYFANMRHVPYEPLANGLYERHAYGKPDALPFMNQGLLDEPLAKTVIHCHPKALLYLNMAWHRGDIYRFALQTHPESIGYVLENLLNENLCVMAAGFHASALAYMPPRFYTRRVLEAACGADSSFLYFVPYHLRTLEVCRIAVELEPTSRQWVPVEHLKALST